jgi:hypothetical protein
MNDNNEKDIDVLLRAMEHPEEYSDGEIEDMMADSATREDYNLMVDAENAYRKDDFSDDEMDAEWNKIAAKRAKNHHRIILRIAASIIGFVMISGIVYATIAIGLHHNESQKTETVEQTIVKHANKTAAAKNDTAVTAKTETKEYRDATLETVISDMATYYNKEVSFANEKVKSIRIYIKWNQAETIDETIDKLNHFEKFTVSVENYKIIVR